MIEAGAIDCDVHPTVPGLDALVPYMSDHWQDMIRTRGIDELASTVHTTSMAPDACRMYEYP